MGFIDKETIRRVAAANDIVEVIGNYFPLKRAGSNWTALCPFHNENSPSFFVNPSWQSFHCFGCGAKGNVIGFVMDYEKLDFPAAVRRLADRAHIPIVEAEPSPAQRKEASLHQRLLALHAEAAKFYHQALLRSPQANAARAYIASRGFTSEAVVRWQMGFAPDAPNALLIHVKKQGYSSAELSQSGLFGKHGSGIYDRFRNRLMFPIHNDLGEVIAFSGRILDTQAKAAKYVNSPETPLFTKGRILFGLHQSKRELIHTRKAIVCEGQIDLISAFESGIQNVIAPQGTAFTEKQAHMLKRFVDSVTLCFDDDPAGIAAAERSIAILFSVGLEVRVAELPPGEDPDSTIRKFGKEELRNRLDQARDFFDCVIDRAARQPDFSEPRIKTALAQKLASAIALIGNPVMRDTTAIKVSGRLGIPHHTFIGLLKKIHPPAVAYPESEPAERTSEKNARVLSRNCQFLCVAALRSLEARQFLRERDAVEILNDPEEARLVNLLAAASFHPDDPTEVASFLAGLESPLQNLLVAIPMDTSGKDGLTVAETTWANLRKQRLEEKKRALLLSLAKLDAHTPQAQTLHKEFLEIQAMLADIPKLLQRV